MSAIQTAPRRRSWRDFTSSGRLPAGGQNFVLDPANGQPQELHDDELFRTLPVSFLIFRVYSLDHRNDAALASALTRVLGDSADAKTKI